MRPLRPLVLRIAVALALVLFLGVLLTNLAGIGSPGEPRALVLSAAATWLLEYLVLLLALRARAPSLSRALEGRGEQDAALLSSATADAVRLPAFVSLALFIAGSAGTVLTVVAALVTRRLPEDVALALVGFGIGLALLGAQLAFAFTARATPDLVSRLGGPADTGVSGTLRGKILVLGVGIGAMAVLLLSPLGYLRHRQEVAGEMAREAARAAEAAVAEAAGRPAAELAEAVSRQARAPAAVLSAAGRLLASAGPIPEASPLPPRPGVEWNGSGWVVVREAGPAGFVAVELTEDALLAHLSAFSQALFFAALLSLLGAALLAWLAADALTLPFRTLGQAADRIAAGDLTVSPPSVSADEMGQLAGQFRRMAQGLTGLVRDVQAASAQVTDEAAQAGSIGERVRRGAIEQHDGVQEVYGAIEDMERSMAQVSRGLVGLSDYVAVTSRTVSETAAAFEEVQHKAGELEQSMTAALSDVEGLGSAGRDAEARLTALEDLAARSGGTLAEVKASVAGLERAAGESESTAAAVAEAAERAGVVMEGTVHGIETLRGAVADAHQRITALGRRSDDIDQVVDFISEVAGRTNLLSLNASIIAAQAGEHGKTFAVVADQIRDLAAQIARSTKSIEDIIHAVREDVGGTAALIDRGDGLAVEGVQLARNSLESLAEIRRSTARGRETAAAIRAAVQAHALSSRDVANLVEMVAEGSRAVATAVQLVGRSVGGVHSVSRGVTGTADRVARALEEQTGLGKQQLESLARLEKMIREITEAVQNHNAATQHVKKALEALSQAAGEHQSAVHGLSSVAEQLGSRARSLADRVHRFKV